MPAVINIPDEENLKLSEVSTGTAISWYFTNVIISLALSVIKPFFGIPLYPRLMYVYVKTQVGFESSWSVPLLLFFYLFLPLGCIIFMLVELGKHATEFMYFLFLIRFENPKLHIAKEKRRLAYEFSDDGCSLTEF